MQMVEILAALGRKLADFGRNESSAQIISRAVGDNEWFTASDVVEAVRAIASDMLLPEHLESWLAHYPALPASPPRNVLVFMAGNIPAVGFADLLCVVTSGHRALVKYSSRDRAIMEYIVELLSDHFAIKEYDCKVDKPDALLAMGSDSTAAMLAREYGDIPRLVRASRSSVAILRGDETTEQLSGLCADVCRYNGRGCRSVSQLLVPEGYDFAQLCSALSKAEVSDKWNSVLRHSRALARMSGVEFIDAERALIINSDEQPMNIATLHYTSYASDQELVDWINARDGVIQCIVANGFNHSRCVPFGESQHPTLVDYPDGIDTMSFLLLI